MANEEKDSVISVVSVVASELAKKRLNFKEEDKKDQSKLAILSLKIDENKYEVERKINAIYNNIKAQYHGMVLPKGLKLETAQFILAQVNENGLISPSQIDVGAEASKQVLINALQSSELKMKEVNQKKVDNIEFYKNIILYNDSKKEELHDFMEKRFGDKAVSLQDFEQQGKNAADFVDNVNINGELEELIKEANSGNVQAAIQLLAIQQAIGVTVNNKNFYALDRNNKKGILVAIELCSKIDTPEGQRALNQVLEKLPEEIKNNIGTRDENGKFILNQENFEKVYYKQMDKLYDRDYFQKTLEETAKTYVENPEYQFENVEDFEEEAKIDGEKRMIENYMYQVEDLRKSSQNDPAREENLYLAEQELKDISFKYLDASLRVSRAISESFGGQDRDEVTNNIIINATIDGLIAYREGKNEFEESEYTKEDTLAIFENLIGQMQLNGKIDSEMILKMNKADLEVAKMIARKYNVKSISDIEILPRKKMLNPEKTKLGEIIDNPRTLINPNKKIEDEGR